MTKEELLQNLREDLKYLVDSHDKDLNFKVEIFVKAYISDLYDYDHCPFKLNVRTSIRYVEDAEGNHAMQVCIDPQDHMTSSWMKKIGLRL